MRKDALRTGEIVDFRTIFQPFSIQEEAMSEYPDSVAISLAKGEELCGHCGTVHSNECPACRMRRLLEEWRKPKCSACGLPLAEGKHLLGCPSYGKAAA